MVENDRFNEEMACKVVLSLMTEGASLVEVAGELGIARDTLYDWTNEESPRFKKMLSDTIKRGRELSNMWWERQGRVSLRDKEFNYVGWYMNMKNRFGWRDSQNIDHTSKGEKITGLDIKIVDGKITDTSDERIEEESSESEKNNG